MNVLIVGKTGQLAGELLRTVPKGVTAVAMGRPELDLNDEVSVTSAIEATGAKTIINAAAYTAVDKAEAEREQAFAVNAHGVGLLASICAKRKLRLLHVSTDFVFGGASALSNGKILPLVSTSPVSPLGVYGESKLAGEEYVLNLVPDSSVIVRSAWVYSSFGNNFVKTMINLMRSKPELGVIADQIGTPTWAKGLASWLWAVALNPSVRGVYHWSDAGVASWYDFAVAIQELGLECGLLSQKIPVRPITTSDYPTPAQRPNYSVLDKGLSYKVGNCEPIHWRTQLASMLAELKASNY